MTESMIIEAVRAVGAQNADPLAMQGAGAVQAADPSSVARFEAALGAQGVQPVQTVPFLSEVAATWQGAHANNQAIVHRIKALAELGGMHGPSMPEMIQLQYEVMNLSFQQEVVTKVADKSSNAIQTLVKNQ
ncbi:MAG: type III secretion system inner rod subunit SctI [Kiritimatiellae bacterium]|nr:type III secretion system inner rod subunit SctI [Kiritimatiellia bacterium]